MRSKLIQYSAAATSAVFAVGLSVAAATPAAASGASPSMVPARNYSCDFGMRTKFHSCDLARNLAYIYVGASADYAGPSTLPGVYSPHSGKFYDFKCSGSSKVTCKSKKGKVYLNLGAYPEDVSCGNDSAGNSVFAWLKAECPFAMNTAEAYLTSPSSFLPAVVEPADGKSYPMSCYEVGEDTMCYNNKDYVIIRHWAAG